MFIVIDIFDTLFPTILASPDSGMPLLFNTAGEAGAEAVKHKQAVVVEI